MLSELCGTNSIIAIQEHWLRPDELDKLSIVNSEFNFVACSGMAAAVSNSIVFGRPFGGVGFLWHKSLNCHMSFVKCDSEGRCCVFKLELRDTTLLLFNVYLPCSDNSADYKSEISFYAGFISDVLESIKHDDAIIMGDFNFDINRTKCGYLIFQQLLDEYKLSYCDKFIQSQDTSTYVNDALNSNSCIDHFIVSPSLLQNVKYVKIVDSNLNFSDHRPISVSMDMPMSSSHTGASEKKLSRVRWDKGGIPEFYYSSGEFLNALPRVDTSSPLTNDQLNVYYDQIVNSLVTAEKLSIVRIPCSALKPFWNEHLDELKQDSMFWHSLWCSCDKPKSGYVFQLKRSTKLKYKLAIRQAFTLYENRFDDDLCKHFMNKKMPEFWKTWSAKFRHNAMKDVYINGSNDSSNVANAFANHFSKVYQKASPDVSDKTDIQELLDGYKGEEYNAFELCDLINVELVDKCIRRLKSGKACGPDELSAEHLVNAHPILVIHLCTLFRAMLFSGCVPDGFGIGTIIPLLKDKTGDVNSLDNYRGITLIPVIAKLFELVILEISSDCLETDNLQFGFKSDVGCANAIFALTSTVDYFKNRGSTVYAAALDISKAFDTVNHYKLFVALSKTGINKSILALLVNWYSKLYVAVRWKGFLSNFFSVGSGVRQGSSLSPSIFNVFMNIFIVKLKALRSGCCIGGHFLGCLLYADDIILISASVDGLQKMLDCCYDVCCDQLLVFNCSKSCCFRIGKSKVLISDMLIGRNKIPWCDSLKYLGITFTAGKNLRVNIEVIKHKFFGACNSVLGNSHSLDQLIQLQLQESFCLPLLQYGLCAVRLTSTQCADLNCCWNSVFRRIFHFRKYDSVRMCIAGLGRLDFHHIRLNLLFKFVKNGLLSSNVIIRFLTRLFTVSKDFSKDCSRIDLKPKSVVHMSFGAVRCAMHNHFIASVN